MRESRSIHNLLGATLILIAIFLIIELIFIQSQAVNVDTEVLIDNAAPTVESVYINNVQFVKSDGYHGGTINSLVAGSYKNLYVTGVVEDLNGRDDLSMVSLVFYRSSVSGGSACVADKNQCYTVSSCDTQNNADENQLDYSCHIQLFYFADSTSTGGSYPSDNWIAKVSVSDGTVSGNGQITKELQTLLALNVPDSVDYGTLSLGQETTDATNQAMIIAQNGNDEADVEVSSDAAMLCSSRGTIPIANQEWSLTDVGYGESGVSSLSSSETDTDLNLGYQTDESTAPTKTLYWNIAVPSSGVEGVCTGVTIVAALSH